MGYNFASFIQRNPFGNIETKDAQVVLLDSLLKEPLANGIFKTQDFYGDGVRLVNVSDLYQDTEVNISSLERINANEDEQQRFGVTKGDIYFVRSSLKPEGIAWTAHLENITEPTVFECHLIRVKPDKDKILPIFLSHYSRTSIARDYLMATASVTTMATIDQPTVANLPVVLPKPEKQRALVADMESARLARQEKLSQAEGLLKGIDGFLLEQLGIKLPKEENKPSFAIRFNAVQDGRVDPHFHHPSFVKLIEVIKTVPYKELGQLAKFSNEIWSPEQETAETFKYIEISGVDIQTGNITTTETLVSEAASRARMLTRNGDILISLTRPHRGAIAQVDHSLDGCVASTGFSIIREITDKRITKDYLWCILRNQVSLQQMLQRSSGGNYPAITEPELQKILIPIPSPKIQEKISSELSHRRVQADTLREEAEREWQNAKENFERALLE